MKFLLILLWLPLVSALPVFPGAEGFGSETVAGREGEVYVVDSLKDSGSGSLRECVEASGPRVCVFEVSGVIWLKSRLVVYNPFLTIAGQTAPSPGIVIRGESLDIQTDDVLVQHIFLRTGDDVPDSLASDYWPQNVGVGVFGSNVVLDHISSSWSVAKGVLISEDATDVTVSNSIVAEGLSKSYHPEGEHSKGMQINFLKEGTVSVMRNFFAHNVRRSPVASSSRVEIVNNLVYDHAIYGIMIKKKRTKANWETYPVEASVIGNVIVDGPSTGIAITPAPILIDDIPPDDNTVCLFCSEEGSLVYLKDNVHEDGVDWDIVLFSTLYEDVENLKAEEPPVSSGLSILPVDEVEDYVLANAGARPADRDAVDARIISEFFAREGHIVNCVDEDPKRELCSLNAGGWPEYKENRHTLVIPEDGDDDNDGYTNVEEWLHEWSLCVEKGVCPETFLRGDVNQDGKVSFRDLVAAVIGGDANGDGKGSFSDVIVVLQNL